MLSDEDREALLAECADYYFSNRGASRADFDEMLHARVEHIASDAARAAERALVERLMARLPMAYSIPGGYGGGGSDEEVAMVRLDDLHDALAALRPEAATCPHGDPTCPCPDGDLCHYEDDSASGTRAMARPEAATTEGACAPSPECSCQCHRMGLLGVSHVAPCCTGSTRGGNDE